MVAGTSSMCRVRNLRDANGNVLDEAGPGFPAEIEGWKDLPSPGDLVLEVEHERRAREVLRVRDEIGNAAKRLEDGEIIANKIAQHRHEYEERLALKRRLGYYKLKQKGPRKPEIIQGNTNKQHPDWIRKFKHEKI